MSWYWKLTDPSAIGLAPVENDWASSAPAMLVDPLEAVSL
jgi:hypothetical protein